MDYLQFLKRNKLHRSNRWIVKYDKNDKVREVKLIFNPDEYRQMKRPRELHTQKQLIKILTKNKELCI